jgi:hypothetical protein
MDDRFEWILWKGGFAAALYFAIVERVDWIHYALIGFVWWMLIASTSALMEGSASRRIQRSPVPQPYVMVFDLGVLASMFLARWYWTAFAYAASCGCLALIQSRAASKS